MSSLLSLRGAERRGNLTDVVYCKSLIIFPQSDRMMLSRIIGRRDSFWFICLNPGSPHLSPFSYAGLSATHLMLMLHHFHLLLLPLFPYHFCVFVHIFVGHLHRLFEGGDFALVCIHEGLCVNLVFEGPFPSP